MWNSEASKLVHQSLNKIYSKHESKGFQLQTPAMEKKLGSDIFNLSAAHMLPYSSLIQWGLYKRTGSFKRNKFFHTEKGTKVTFL